MKIGFVLDDTLDKPDGVQQYVLSLSNWLKQQGHEIHYLVGQSARTDIENVHSLARNVPVKFNGNRLSIPLPTSRKRIRELLAELELDVLHVQMPYSPFMAARVIGAVGDTTTVVGTFHILPFSWVERVGTRLLGLWLHRSLKRFDAIAAVSGAARTFAERSFGVKAVVLPNVVDVAAFRKGRRSQQDKQVVAFLGRLVPRKGAMELLQAVALLPAELQATIDVQIAGKGPLLTKLQSFVKSRQLNCVSFKGFISEEAKPDYLADATVAVFPSLGGESFGIVLVEAMAAKAGVVVGGNNPGYQSVLGSWPRTLIDPSNPKQFAHTLAVLLQDVDARMKLHAEQQAAVLQYDVTRVGTEWLKIYEQTLQARAKVQ